MKAVEKKTSPATPPSKSRKSILKKKKKTSPRTNDQSVEQKKSLPKVKKVTIQTESRVSIRTPKRESQLFVLKGILKKKVKKIKKKKLRLKRKKRKGKFVKKIEFAEPPVEIQTNVLDLYPDGDLVGFNRNIHCLRLDKEAQELLGCVIGTDLTVEHNWKFVSKYKMVYDIMGKVEESQFFHIFGPLEKTKNEFILIIHDKNLDADYLFICLDPMTPFQNLCSYVIATMNAYLRIYRIKFRHLMRYFTKRIWKTKRAVRKSGISSYRHRMKVACIFEKNYLMTREMKLISAEHDTPSEMSLYTMIMKIHAEWCDIPRRETYQKVFKRVHKFPSRDSSMQICRYKPKKGIQTIAYGIKDKAIQVRYPCTEENMLSYRTFGSVVENSTLYDKIMLFGMQDYMQMDLYAGSLRGFKHTRHASKKINLIREGESLPIAISTTPDHLRYVRQKFKIMIEYRKYENISCVSWHPLFIDVVAIAYRGYIHVDKHWYVDAIHETEELEDEPIPDYEIVIWKISTDIVPMKIIYCECEIRCLQYNVDYPSLLAGANSCGQIYLWDLNCYPVIESEYIDVMKAKFKSTTIPWIYTPSPVVHIAIESSEMSSHQDFIHDLQWVPSINQFKDDDGSVDLSGKLRSGQFITASADGTIGMWSLETPHPINRKRFMKRRKGRVSRVTPDIQPFTQYDRHMKPEKYVLATMNGIPVPVTAVSVNNMRQLVVPGRLKTNYFSYRSMRNALKKQRPVIHACVTAALGNGLVVSAMLDRKYYAKRRTDLDMTKELNWTPKSAKHIQGRCFMHEGLVVSLKRNRFADDVMLSVSSYSFCIWKEQSSLYKERQAKMPWLKRWYSEEVDAPPPAVQILPIWWKRKFSHDTQYINGDWSSERSNQFILLLSDGIVEVYDTTFNEGGPAMSVIVGCETVNSVLPFMFSTRIDEMGFIEDEVLHLCKLPDFCKLNKNTDAKYMQKFVCHETWRRNHYAAWCLQYNHDHEEFVRMNIEDHQGMINERRMCRTRWRYLLCRYRKARAKFAEKVYEEGKLAMPRIWWDRVTKGKVLPHVYKKKVDFDLFELKDIIDLFTEEELVLFDRLHDHCFTDLQCLWTSCLEWRRKKLFRLKKRYAKLYWKIRHEQTHAYDYLYGENAEEDHKIAEAVTDSSLEAEIGSSRRQKEYGLIYEFSPTYHALRLQDLLVKKIRLGKGPFGAREVFVCRSNFSDYIDNAYKKGLFRLLPQTVNDRDDVLWCPPMNRIQRIYSALRMHPLYSGNRTTIQEQALFIGSFESSLEQMIIETDE